MAIRRLESPAAKAVCLLFLASTPVAAQFQGLATDEHGAVLYFSSPIRQTGQGQTFHSKIFRWDAAGGIRVVAEVQSEVQPGGTPGGCDTHTFDQLSAPQVSADGTVLAYTAGRPPPGSRFCAGTEVNQGIVVRPSGQVRLDGNIAISPDGRYAISTPQAALTNGYHIVTDLVSGASAAIAGAFDGSAGKVTDDATIVTPEPSAVILTARDGATRILPTNSADDGVIIDRSGRMLVYLTRLAPIPGGSIQSGRLSRIDLTSGRETPLATMGYALGNPVLTSDAATLFFTDINLGQYPFPTSQARRLFAVGTGGSGLRLVPTGASPLESVIVSGDGLVAYATGAGSGLARIDLPSGKVTQLAGAPPFVTAAYGVFPPQTTVAALGSFITLVVSGLNGPSRLTFCGQPVPVTRVNSYWLRFQVPWDAPLGACQAVVQTDSPFEHGIDLEVREVDPQFPCDCGAFILHQDFSGPITQAAPAHPGETIVTYMTGLGPVDNSGQLTRPGFTCLFDGVAGVVSYAGLAPGFPGIYQVNVTAPNLSPRSTTLSCGWATGMDTPAPFAHTTVWVE